MNEQPKWIKRAKDTYKFHRLHLLADDKWTVRKTADALRRSLGSVCEDLLIARWCKTHERQLEKFEFAYEGLEFIRNKQKEQELEEIQ